MGICILILISGSYLFLNTLEYGQLFEPKVEITEQE
jgi:hypothetical protein